MQVPLIVVDPNTDEVVFGNHAAENLGVLPGTRMLVHGALGDLPAVVGLKAHHLTPADEKYIAHPASELYLDAGFASAEQAADAGLRVGDLITYAPGTTRLANGRLAGISMDDRVAVATLLQLVPGLLSSPPPCTVHLGFSVQEEFNVRGTLALAARLQPDVALQVDVAPAADTPDLNGFTPVRLGGGPVLTRFSFHGRGTLGGLVPHPGVLAVLERAALRAGVQLQRQAIVGLITDAAFLPMATGEGIAAAEVAIPVRYTHSPVETVQLSDVSATVELARALNVVVVAEGVENATTLESLRRLGADVAQGFHIALPLTPNQLDTFLGQPSHHGLLPEHVPL